MPIPMRHLKHSVALDLVKAHQRACERHFTTHDDADLQAMLDAEHAIVDILSGQPTDEQTTEAAWFAASEDSHSRKPSIYPAPKDVIRALVDGYEGFTETRAAILDMTDGTSTYEVPVDGEPLTTSQRINAARPHVSRRTRFSDELLAELNSGILTDRTAG